MRNNVLSSFFSNFLWKFGEQIISQVVSFVISIILARILSPNDYGIIAIINVFVVLANVFVTSGFSNSLIQKDNATDTDFATIFWSNLFFSIIIYFILFFSAPLVGTFYRNNKLINVFRVLALSIPVSAFNSIQLAYVARHMLFKRIFVSTTVASISSGIIGIAFAELGFGLWSLVVQNISNIVLSTIVLFIQIPWRPRFKFSRSSFHNLFGYSWQVLLADFSGNFFAQLRNLVIGKFFSTSSLAFYNRGNSFPNLISNNVDNTISSVLFPVLSNQSDNRGNLKRMVRRSLRTSTYLIMPLMFGLAAVASPLIKVLLTDKWMKAVPFLQILSVSNAFSTITNTNLQAMKASGRSDIFLKIELIKKPVYIILLVFSIHYNVIFVAVTMLIYSVYASLVNMRPNKKIIGYTFLEQIHDIAPSMLLSTFMGIVVWPISLLRLPSVLILLLQICTGITFYILGSIILKIEPFLYLTSLIKNKIKCN